MARIRRSEKTREALLEQGINLLSEHGYHGTGLKLILDTVKVPKGSFYNYFPSKEHFVSEILDTYAANLLLQFDEYLTTTQDDPLLIVQKVYGSMISVFEAEGCLKGCLLGNMAAEIGAHSELCRVSMQKTLAAWKKRIVVVFENAQSQGIFRDDVSAEALADVFWCTWEGGILRMKIDGDTKVLRHSLDCVLTTLFAKDKV